MSNSHHVLVIDDDAAMRSMVADFLDGEGYKVSQCALASEALQKFKDGEFGNENPQESSVAHIDLIITDLNMPGMTGIEFTEKFHELAPHIPVIVITAFGSIETAIEAVRKGAFDYTITTPARTSEPIPV